MQTLLKSIFVSIIIVLTVTFSATVNAQMNNEKFVVVLDAGHGGREPGKVAKSGLKEKDITLKIALAVGKELEKNKDIKVVYTRKTDVFVDLFVRGKIANDANADLFVSLHCNAHHSQASGSETYVLGLHRNKTNFEVAKRENSVIFSEENHEENYKGFDPNSPESFVGLTIMQEEYLDQSILLAKNIQDNFTNKLKRKNRGVKQAGFIVLHQTVMPSVLVESGFITNKYEGKYLNSKKGQAEIATAISNAILKYKKMIDASFTEDTYIIEEDTIATNDTPVVLEEKIIKNTVFKVQIAAGSKKIEPKPYNFKGLEEVSREKEDDLYKYYYGYTSDINKIKSMQLDAKNKGFKSAYIVAYKDGKRISLEKALNDGAK
ncbi:N-acetylmuramoyl-L-alanine amidase [uncultured Lacinutrix sp.]|uniref:N-acetylmuramoyl-L-alanine amidase family protein n=1 Tax=uncultured Lacinutrix sp. TaxID=574032 RepID=UPI002634D86F|nr:N-acetylmuramoyl-L-alanine amidase [uncultured Lacinutrix sp.]